MDLELASTNAELQRTLAEKETILAALPVGVLALDGGGVPAWANPEAERIEAVVTERGLTLATLPEGEQEHGGGARPLCLSVRRVALQDGGALVVVEDRSQVAHLTREVHRLVGEPTGHLGPGPRGLGDPDNFLAVLDREAEPHPRPGAADQRFRPLCP